MALFRFRSVLAFLAGGKMSSSSSELHYLAIGSMLNPVSVENRKLNLEKNAKATPAVLMDHTLVFFGAGYAEARYEKGAKLHGVLYQNVPPEDMSDLDALERDYFRKLVDVTVYPPGGNYQDSSTTKIVHNVGVYCRTEEDIEASRATDKPPNQRYLDIMIEGAKHYQVDASFVEFLEKHESRPRASPSEYMTLSIKEGALEKTMTREFVETTGTGLDGNPLYMTHNGRVVELVKDGENDAFFEEFPKYRHDHGIDIELFFAKLQYDPKYGIPKTMEEVTPELAAYQEHNFCEYMESNNFLHKWSVVAKLSD